MIRRFIGSDADRIGPPGEAIRIRAIGSDPLGALGSLI